MSKEIQAQLLQINEINNFVKPLIDVMSCNLMFKHQNEELKKSIEHIVKAMEDLQTPLIQFANIYNESMKELCDQISKIDLVKTIPSESVEKIKNITTNLDDCLSNTLENKSLLVSKEIKKTIVTTKQKKEMSFNDLITLLMFIIALVTMLQGFFPDNKDLEKTIYASYSEIEKTIKIEADNLSSKIEDHISN